MSEKKKEIVSEEFMQAFHSGGGGIVRTCECGITWFNYMDAGCFEEGELEQLEAKNKENSNLYRAVDYTVDTYVLDGKEFVCGCDCNAGLKYEKLILRHARSIAEYLNTYAKKLRDKADNVTVKGFTP